LVCASRLFANFINVFFFVSNIIFGKTKQKPVTLIAAAFKAFLSVAAANVRLSRRKLNAGNVYDLFRNVLFHISPISIQKGAQPKPRTEKRKLQVVAKRTYTPTDITPSNGSRIFTKRIRLTVS
jgi:hypothetical protein